MGRLRTFDLVIVEQSSAPLVNCALMLRRRVFGAPPKLAFWGHGKNLQKEEVRPQRWLKTSFARQADHWFAYTKLSGEIVRQLGIREDIITVVNNSIDTSDLTSAATMDRAANAMERRRLGIGEGPVAVFCARLIQRKALPSIVEACRVARKSLPDLTLAHFDKHLSNCRLISL